MWPILAPSNSPRGGHLYTIILIFKVPPPRGRRWGADIYGKEKSKNLVFVVDDYLWVRMSFAYRHAPYVLG